MNHILAETTIAIYRGTFTPPDYVLNLALETSIAAFWRCRLPILVTTKDFQTVKATFVKVESKDEENPLESYWETDTTVLSLDEVLWWMYIPSLSLLTDY